MVTVWTVHPYRGQGRRRVEEVGGEVSSRSWTSCARRARPSPGSALRLGPRRTFAIYDAFTRPTADRQAHSGGPKPSPHCARAGADLFAEAAQPSSTSGDRRRQSASPGHLDARRRHRGPMAALDAAKWAGNFLAHSEEFDRLKAETDERRLNRPWMRSPTAPAGYAGDALLRCRTRAEGVGAWEFVSRQGGSRVGVSGGGGGQEAGRRWRAGPRGQARRAIGRSGPVRRVPNGRPSHTPDALPNVNIVLLFQDTTVGLKGRGQADEPGFWWSVTKSRRLAADQKRDRAATLNGQGSKDCATDQGPSLPPPPRPEGEQGGQPGGGLRPPARPGRRPATSRPRWPTPTRMPKAARPETDRRWKPPGQQGAPGRL